MVGVLVALVAALLTVPIAGSVAYAAPAPATTVVTPNGTTIVTTVTNPTPDVQDGLVASDELTNGSDTPTVGTAGTRCETSWVRVTERNAVHITLYWFQLNTYWCWNGVTVTYHRTYPTWDITTLGGDVGWQYRGIPDGIQFNCYVASGSNRNCSGNHEAATAHFELCVLRIGCVQNTYIHIEEWENYHGQFFWHT